MSKRNLLVACLLVASVAVSAVRAEPVTDDSAKLANRLMARVSLEKPVDATLENVLELLEARYELPILLDYKSILGRDNQADNREIAEVHGRPVKLRGMKNIRLETLLKSVLSQIDAEYVIEPDHILIVSADKKRALLQIDEAMVLPELNGGQHDVATRDPRDVKIVTAGYTEQTLTEILKDLSARAGRSAVAGEIGEAAEKKITVNFHNVPFESAIAALAEKAGLRAAKQGNTVVVVTPDRLETPEPKLSVALGGGLGGGNSILSLDDLAGIVRLFQTAKNPDAEALAGRLKSVEAEKADLMEQLKKIKEAKK
jgi:hypothetical protein